MQQSIDEKPPKVCILLSSYNGEQYIKTQIESILAQIDVDIELVIRDDGSTDSTRDIIKSYGKRIKLLEGNNCGCEHSFAELLKYKSDAEYYAFSDQDDSWFDNKVIREVEAIRYINGPALAACNLLVCDGELNEKKVMHSPTDIEQIRYSMKNNYLCNMHGCVLLWNSALHNKLRDNVPALMISHDGWVNTVANSIGTTVIIDDALIKYRIHDNNVAGYANNFVKRALKGVRIYLGRNHPRRDVLAKDVIDCFNDEMDHESNGYNTLMSIAKYKTNFANKIRLLQSDIIRESGFPDRILWTLCVILEKY